MPGRGAASFPQAYSTTTFLGNAEYYTPLPRRPLSSGSVPNPDPFLDCITSSVQLCGRRFTGPGFRSCLYGMMTASNLLPTGVARMSGRDLIDPEGAYAEGLTYYCPYASVTNW